MWVQPVFNLNLRSLQKMHITLQVITTKMKNILNRCVSYISLQHLFKLIKWFYFDICLHTFFSYIYDFHIFTFDFDFLVFVSVIIFNSGLISVTLTFKYTIFIFYTVRKTLGNTAAIYTKFFIIWWTLILICNKSPLDRSKRKYNA